MFIKKTFPFCNSLYQECAKRLKTGAQLQDQPLTDQQHDLLLDGLAQAIMSFATSPATLVNRKSRPA